MLHFSKKENMDSNEVAESINTLAKVASHMENGNYVVCFSGKGDSNGHEVEISFGRGITTNVSFFR